eukprot:COSAG05_NODE_1236_length_5437_cov_15.230611_7_plen_95_part_00
MRGGWGGGGGEGERRGNWEAWGLGGLVLTFGAALAWAQAQQQRSENMGWRTEGAVDSAGLQLLSLGQPPWLQVPVQRSRRPVGADIALGSNIGE